MSYNVDKMLSNCYEMDKFIRNLSYYNITNCNGSSYRKVRLCYYKNGILLTSKNHRDGYCSISICTEPNAGIRLGCQDSWYDGNPNPKPTKGEFVTVWSNGSWISWANQGPWYNKIVQLLHDLKKKLEIKILEKKKEEELKKRKNKEKKLERRRKLIEKWSD